MDGLALLQAVRAITDELPVLMLTGTADVELAQRALDTGAFDFLSKPFEVDDLADGVKAALRWHQLKRKQGQYREALTQWKRRQAELAAAYATRHTSDIERLPDPAVRALIRESQEHAEQSVKRMKTSSERLKQTIQGYEKQIQRQGALSI